MRVVCFLSIFFVSSIAFAQAMSQPFTQSNPITPFEPLQIIAKVRENYPELAVLQAEATAAQLRTPQAGALEDPRFTVMPNFINPAIKGQGEVEFWVKQALPGPGNRGLRAKVATRSAEAAALAVVESQRTAEQLAWVSIATILALDKELEVINLHFSFVDAITEAAELSYATRRATLSEVLSAQTMRIELERRQLEIKGERAGEVAMLNFLMGLPVSTQLATAQPTPLLPVVSSLGELLLRANARPSYQASATRLEAANAQVELARKERQPDYEVGVALMPQFDGTLQFGAFVEVMAPIYRKNKQDKALEEATAMAEAEEARLLVEQATIAKEVSKSYTTYISMLAQVELIETRLTPTAKLTYDAALTAYQSNQTTISEVLQAEIELLHLEIMLQQMRSEALIARANLEAAVGGEVK